MGLEYDLAQDGRFSHRRGSSQKARFVVYEFRDGAAVYVRDDIPAEAAARLRALPPRVARCDPASVRDILGGGRVWAGSVYVFDAWPAARHIGRVHRHGRHFLLHSNGRRAATATAARQDRTAAEIIVATGARFRRRGYGRAVAAAWARYCLLNRRIPFYSHVQANSRSERLAASLGLRLFARLAAYD